MGTVRGKKQPNFSKYLLNHISSNCNKWSSLHYLCAMCFDDKTKDERLFSCFFWPSVSRYSTIYVHFVSKDHTQQLYSLLKECLGYCKMGSFALSATHLRGHIIMLKGFIIDGWAHFLFTEEEHIHKTVFGLEIWRP